MGGYMFRQVINGIRRHPWRFLISIPIALAALWGIAEPFATTYTRLLGLPLLTLLAAGALLISCIQAWSPRQISLRWDALQLSVAVKAGDLFTQDCNLAITTDDFFLTQSSKLVNPRSLVGQLVQREYKGQAKDLDHDIEHALAGFSGATTVESGIENKNKRYPVGTTASIRRSDKSLFVTALCQVDLASQHGRATANDIWAALQGMWKTLAQNPSGKPLAVPLIGTGQTGSGLSHTAVLNITLASLLTAARQLPIHDEIHIIIPLQSLEHIDLQSIREAWRSAGAT